MFLLARDAEARAHRAAGQAPALAHTNATLQRAREAPAVLRKSKAQRLRCKFEASLLAQVLCGGIGVDDLAGIHPSLRVPDPLEFPEGPDELFAEHPGKELRARLAVAMLAG